MSQTAKLELPTYFILITSYQKPHKKKKEKKMQIRKIAVRNTSFPQ